MIASPFVSVSNRSLPASGRRALMAGICVSTLVMGACSGGDKPIAEEITVETASLGLSKADESALSQYFSITPRPGTEAETLQLLTELGLGESAEIDATRVIDGSTVTYTDWTATEEDSVFKAESFTLIGLHEMDDRPTFDKMVINGLVAEEFEEISGERQAVATARLNELTVVSPSPDLAESLAALVRGQDGADLRDSDAADNLTVGGSFKAMHLDGLSIDVAENDRSGTVTIKQVIVGNDAETERMDLVVESVDFDWAGSPAGQQETGGFSLKMDGVTALGVDVSQGAGSEFQNPVPIGLFANVVSPSGNLPYRQIDLGAVDLKTALFDLTTEGLEADSETKGSETTLRSVLSPTEITLKNISGTPLAAHMQALRENGLDVITLKGSQTMTLDRMQDRLVVSDARFELDEGLRTRCDYSVQGVQAAADSLEESGAKPPVFKADSEETREADIDAFIRDSEAYSAAQAEANKLIKLEGLTCDIQDLTDNSLVDRGYAVASAVTGSPVAVLKGGAKTMIALGSMTARTEFERDMMDIAGSGLIDFIDSPGQTLTITVAPDEPVSLTDVMGESGANPSIKPLGLKVEVQ